MKRFINRGLLFGLVLRCSALPSNSYSHSPLKQCELAIISLPDDGSDSYNIVITPNNSPTAAPLESVLPRVEISQISQAMLDFNVIYPQGSTIDVHVSGVSDTVSVVKQSTTWTAVVGDSEDSSCLLSLNTNEQPLASTTSHARTFPLPSPGSILPSYAIEACSVVNFDTTGSDTNFSLHMTHSQGGGPDVGGLAVSLIYENLHPGMYNWRAMLPAFGTWNISYVSAVNNISIGAGTMKIVYGCLSTDYEFLALPWPKSIGPEGLLQPSRDNQASIAGAIGASIGLLALVILFGFQENLLQRLYRSLNVWVSKFSGEGNALESTVTPNFAILESPPSAFSYRRGTTAAYHSTEKSSAAVIVPTLVTEDFAELDPVTPSLSHQPVKHIRTPRSVPNSPSVGTTSSFTSSPTQELTEANDSPVRPEAATQMTIEHPPAYHDYR